MRTVDLTPHKKNEVSTRKIRCVSSPQSKFNRKLPSISLAGVWLQEAGFEVGDFARIVVLDGVLVISCERLPDNENREK
ncbi:SymE family type I addiction module toxin [Odoribacter splanchnicus]|uniref:Type I toxin-antitoxin system SymE family toxin n=1 Tax=Odoribacter splanchnicus TaxID=28118 RepID=A0AAW5C5X8_9BACT|nr:SymE family type I addiction module toxin [Odoribacter splanchnicus]MBV4275744.1 type I toxin-antitoxin system SymE family toxin [Odoribacter splanchnicus]MBV4289701.1 type I toxin-antitoxin system SymE family toxin [Odoribacter splanchnicus]MBV4398593.1 type I toxin-antitoxin system SymE family toxin [Odoribacter splanchnicus]MBV4407258.1 type I toxin-antitoxin system SymE family toxin [Odoribacter splanchnicus]MCG4960218.1 type I toxin-antitoxin system SymE family toxin [Odoribacter splan